MVPKDRVKVMEVTEIIWGGEKRREGRPQSQGQLPLVPALKILSLIWWRR